MSGKQQVFAGLSQEQLKSISSKIDQITKSNQTVFKESVRKEVKEILSGYVPGEKIGEELVTEFLPPGCFFRD